MRSIESVNWYGRGRIWATLAVVAMSGMMVAGGRLLAHGEDGRRVEVLSWPKQNITRVLGTNRSELGLNGSRVGTSLTTVDGMACLFGDLFAFDVDDDYAFDIDEPVEVTVTYAPGSTQPFTVAWDRNSGEGYGGTAITPEPGAMLREVTVSLDRTRFAGLGILDTDLAIGARGGITLCDLSVTRSGTTTPPSQSGTIRINVVDEQTGAPVPARLGLYDATGRTPLPSSESLLLHRYADETRLLWVSGRITWPSANRQIFYVDGSYEADVPAGSYELVASKGLEYRFHQSSVDIVPNQTTTVTISMQRYANQPERGWYSGDDHLHLMRDQVNDMNVWGMVAAEDVHVGNLLEMGNIVTTYYRQPAWGEAGRFLRDGHMVASGQEGPRTAQRGHTIHLNNPDWIDLSADQYFSYNKVFEESHSQGGVSGYAHYGQDFNGARGLALDMPFDLVDFIEVLQGGRLRVDGWYPFLNLGFKVTPSAGSDYPYFGPSLPGVERYYVRLDGAFDADDWYRSFRAGHVFVTNGPLLDFTINGVGMGEELRVARGTTLDVDAIARLNPDFQALGQLELVVHGDVVATAEGNGQERLELQTELVAERSMWVAIRAVGEQDERVLPGQGPQRRYVALAHSAPIYVVVDGQPFWKTEDVPSLVQEQRQMLQDLLYAPVDPMRDLEAWATLEVLAPQWDRQRRLLRARVEEADAKYGEILRLATGPAAASMPRLSPALVVLALVMLTGALARSTFGARVMPSDVRRRL